jgi:hypothetical protein
MTHDPTRDCEHGRLKGKCDVCDLQAEVERLNKALTWEQNRSERIGTHGPGCHTWGPAHYECLLRVNAELVEALKYCRQKIAYMQTNGEWYSPGRAIEKADAALAKATGEQP